MDIEYLLWLQELREITGNVLTNFFSYVTTLGEPQIALALTAIIYWTVNKKTGLYVMFFYQIGIFMNQVLKITACVYRPWVRDSRVVPVASAGATATGYSFPSGHTALSMGIWGSLAKTLWKQSKRCAYFLIGLILLIGFSRNYLGVHTPQDVIVSIVVGIILLFLGDKWYQWMIKSDKNFYISISIGGLAVLGLIAYASLKDFPMDYVDGELLVDPAKMVRDTFDACGITLGYFTAAFLERKTVNFDPTQLTTEQKIWRAMIGVLGYQFIAMACRSFFELTLPGALAQFLRGFTPIFYIIWLFPWLCKVCGKNKENKA